MKDLLKGLEVFGFGSLDELDAFKPAPVVSNEAPKDKTVYETQPEDCVFFKSYTCPVCDKNFRENAIKTSKTKFLEMDVDLMPRHSPIFPFYYNVLICPSCGYGALVDNFSKITDNQCKFIKSNISAKYKYKHYSFPYSEDDAIERYKYALLNSIVKRGRESEKAYLCLVLSWLYKVKEDEDNRMMYVESAYDGFTQAYSKDTFPIYGMNESVMAYLLGEFARELGKLEEAKRFAGMVLSSRTSTSRVKEMAQDLRDRVVRDNKILLEKAQELAEEE